MRHHHNQSALLCGVLQTRHNDLRIPGIQVACGFVCQNDFLATDQGTGNGDALLFAYTEFSGPVTESILNVQASGKFVNRIRPHGMVPLNRQGHAYIVQHT
jgi:hypothetical protein